MESKSGSNQTVWELAKETCKEVWGKDTLYAGRFCISLTSAYWYIYVDRFGRLPPKCIRDDLALKAVKIQKSNLGTGFWKAVVEHEVSHQISERNSNGWARNHKVSDFDG